MAENTNPILLSFGYGQKANLPTTHTQGKIYITTDTKEMYIDLPGSSDRLCLSNFRIGDTLPSGENGQFFVKTTTTGTGESAVKSYALYAYDNGWKKIVDTKTLEDSISTLRTDLGNKGDTAKADGSAFARIAKNAADIGTLNSTVEQLEKDIEDFEGEVIANKYLKLDGTSTMAGNLQMGSKKITGLADGDAATDAATVNNVTSAVATAKSAILGKASGETSDFNGTVAGAYAAAATADSNATKAKEEADKKAPIDHASTALTYGGGTSEKYGHVKLSDAINGTNAASNGYTAATPKAVSDAVTEAKAYTDVAKTAILGEANYAGTVKGAYAAAATADSKAVAAQNTANEALGTANNAVPTASLPTILEPYMPKAGGQFTGDVSFAAGETLTINAPTADSHAATKKYVDDGDAALDSKIEGLKSSIGNLSNIMNFVGVTTTALTDGATNGPKTIKINNADHTAVAGDVVLYDGKEFVCVAVTTSGAQWNLIGDTSALSTAVSALQGTVGTKPTTGPVMDDKLWDEVADLRTDLGETNDPSTKTTTAFGRIAALEAENNTQNSAIVGLGNQLTWQAF